MQPNIWVIDNIKLPHFQRRRHHRLAATAPAAHVGAAQTNRRMG
jgi:hypothetical protein